MMPLNQNQTQSQSQLLNQKPKPSIGLFLLYIFAAAALVIFIAYPKYTDWKASKTQVTSDQDKLTQIQTEAAKVNSEIGTVSPADLSTVASAIPATPNLPDLYAQIESLANAATVKLVSVQGIIDQQATIATIGGASSDDSGDIGTPVPTSGGSTTNVGPIKVPAVPSSLGTVSVSVDVSGTYSAVQQFLSSLYTSLRIVTVQQVIVANQKATGGAVTLGAGASTQDTVDLKAQVQTYYSK